MRLTPEQFQQVYSIFIGIILLFFAFVGIKMLMFKLREDDPPPRRRPPAPGAGGTGEYRPDSHATFGTSGVGPSDMSPAGMTSASGDLSSSGDVASTSWDSSDTGGDSGSGDFSGGGGDSGGGGSSGSWS